MKKKVLIAYGILIIIGVKLFVTFVSNEKIISNYKSGIYDINAQKKMLLFNFVEPYIAHYNYGNILYKNSDFDGAIKEYNKALKLFPTEEKECDIRINLALAMLANIDEKSEADEKIEKLLEARKKLCEVGCANENDSYGHNETAEELKSEIDELIEKLKQTTDSEEKESDEKEDKQEEQIEQKIDKIQEQLEQIQRDAQQARDENLDYIRTTGYE